MDAGLSPERVVVRSSGCAVTSACVVSEAAVLRQRRGRRCKLKMLEEKRGGVGCGRRLSCHPEIGMH